MLMSGRGKGAREWPVHSDQVPVPSAVCSLQTDVEWDPVTGSYHTYKGGCVDSGWGGQATGVKCRKIQRFLQKRDPRETFSSYTAHNWHPRQDICVDYSCVGFLVCVFAFSCLFDCSFCWFEIESLSSIEISFLDRAYPVILSSLVSPFEMEQRAPTQALSLLLLILCVLGQLLSS